jgi:DNA-binding PadR family transcriptional regulator
LLRLFELLTLWKPLASGELRTSFATATSIDRLVTLSKFSIDTVRVLLQYVAMRHVAERSPLSEAVFFILASIAVEPRHGYSILREIENLSGGRVRLSTGTLYGALRRLLDHEWIERFDTGDISRDKQSYRLTSLGRRVLQHEHERLQDLARIASASLRAKEA